MTYEQLDFIADSYIPVLSVFTLFYLVKMMLTSEFRQVFRHLVSIFLSIIIVYLVMFLDIKLGIWPYLGFDYSTHTALSLAFVSYYIFRGKAQMMIAVTSLFSYFTLMLYQEYHTVVDILSTSFVLLPLFFILQIKGQK